MVAETALRSARIEVEDEIAAIELCYARGWTDGLPVVPPTPAAVAACLDAAGLLPEQVLGQVPERARRITAEKVAINAVMAGCRPEYMPVVVAAVEAMCDPAFNLHGSMASTGGAAPLVVVSGPAVEQLGFNAGVNCFGPGNRANATVGRALRLVLMNVCGAQPGVMDKATLGHPGKYTYCIGEQRTGWEPLHATRGLPAEASAVTVLAAEAPHYVAEGASGAPEPLLDTFADAIGCAGFTRGRYVVVICPEHRAVFERAGWSKREIAAYLAEHAGRSLAELKRARGRRGSVEPGDEARWERVLRGPDDVLIVAAGGEAGVFSALIPPWAGGAGSEPITRVIGECATCTV